MEKLHKNEIKLIKLIREIKYGEITIKIQDGVPVMVEKATEKVKL